MPDQESERKMKVQLYVYDLSNGMARNISAAFLGIQLDAIYHTGVVMNGVEYTYDGGLKAVQPGDTMGGPMEILDLGETNLPMDVIHEYLDSLKTIYTPEAYDLFSHNCNNFSNDFTTFLLGTGIPAHIVNLPDTVLNTPFGKMMKPQIDMFVKERQSKRGGLIGVGGSSIEAMTKKATTMIELKSLLDDAKDSCALVFFTSPTCRPCKGLYPLYDELATQYKGKATLVLVDISKAYDVATQYDVRSTPTFMTFLRGEEENRWVGADTSTLRGNLNLLVQMAWPVHPHENIDMPSFRAAENKPILYTKAPPLAKLKVKLGKHADEPAIVGMMNFITARQNDAKAESTLPDVAHFSEFLYTAPSRLPSDLIFVVVDILRTAIVDPRLSGYYAEEKDHVTMVNILTYINGLKECPYSLRLVALQLLCNLFSSPLYPQHILCCRTLTEPIIQLITTSLLDESHHNVRVAAASLCFNIAAANLACRVNQKREALAEGDQVEVAASLLHAIESEEVSTEALRGYLIALGYLVFCTPIDGELVEMLKIMDAGKMILAKKEVFHKEPLLSEIGDGLLGKGLE